MYAIFKRELNAYFDSPLGYVFLSVYFLFAGFFFFNYNLYGNTTDMRALFDMMFTVTIFLIPILTMRLMSEDRKAKTDQLLLMAPVTTTEIVLGKFLASVIVYLLSMCITLIMALVLNTFAPIEWAVVLGHFIGLFLLGSTLIAIGMFISSLTENQIIAAVGGFCVGFFLMLLDTIGNAINNSFLASVFSEMSFHTRYQNFTLGIFSISDVIFFISVTVLFVYFSIMAIERRRLN